MRLARVQHPDRHLVIAGDGPERALLEQTREKLGLTGVVHLLGFRDDVSALVRMFDVFALPSLTEGTSVTLLEAMLAVPPVLATRVGGNPEIVVYGRTGFLAESNDGAAMASRIGSLLQNPSQAADFGNEGRARVLQQFDFQDMVVAYAEHDSKLSTRGPLGPSPSR